MALKTMKLGRWQREQVVITKRSKDYTLDPPMLGRRISKGEWEGNWESVVYPGSQVKEVFHGGMNDGLCWYYWEIKQNGEWELTPGFNNREVSSNFAKSSFSWMVGAMPLSAIKMVSRENERRGISTMYIKLFWGSLSKRGTEKWGDIWKEVEE